MKNNNLKETSANNGPWAKSGSSFVVPCAKYVWFVHF